MFAHQLTRRRAKLAVVTAPTPDNRLPTSSIQSYNAANPPHITPVNPSAASAPIFVPFTTVTTDGTIEAVNHLRTQSTQPHLVRPEPSCIANSRYVAQAYARTNLSPFLKLNLFHCC